MTDTLNSLHPCAVVRPTPVYRTAESRPRIILYHPTRNAEPARARCASVPCGRLRGGTGPRGGPSSDQRGGQRRRGEAEEVTARPAAFTAAALC